MFYLSQLKREADKFAQNKKNIVVACVLLCVVIAGGWLVYRYYNHSAERENRNVVNTVQSVEDDNQRARDNINTAIDDSQRTVDENKAVINDSRQLIESSQRKLEQAKRIFDEIDRANQRND